MVRDVSTPLEMTKKVAAIDPNRLGGSVNRPYQRMTNKRKAYAGAGVDVDLGNRLKRGLPRLARETHGPQVLGKIGGFGGLFRATFRGLRRPVLVVRIEGLGTKLKIVSGHD